MRTLFVVCDSTKRLLVVEAFNENGNKTNGKDSYDRAIRNAISNYIDMKEE